MPGERDINVTTRKHAIATAILCGIAAVVVIMVIVTMLVTGRFSATLTFNSAVMIAGCFALVMLVKHMRQMDRTKAKIEQWASLKQEP
jgi:archaellum biogenesis protein FlaJ (TadC family)